MIHKDHFRDKLSSDSAKSVLVLNQSLDLSRAAKLSAVHCHFQIQAETILSVAGSRKGFQVHSEVKYKPIFPSKAVKHQG